MTSSSQLNAYAAAFVRSSEAPTSVKVRKLPLSAQQKSWVDAAWKTLSVKKAIDIDVNLVNIYSPTGFEREVNQFVVDYWKNFGIHSYFQELDPQQGNAVAKIRGDGSGPTLLLACPIDTHWTGTMEEDGLQWGDPMRRDNLRPAVVEGQTVIGLGSNNDKGLATAIMLAVEAVHKSGASLKGTLIASTLAGGAPALSPPHEPRKNISLCSGVWHLLSQGHSADFALYHKPGYHVSWEEPGMCYFRIRVKGDPEYMGTESRPDRPYRVLTDTARIIMALDKWSQEFREKAKGGTYRPSMAIGSVRAGAPNKPNWSPAISEIFLDMRPAPWTSPSEVNHIFHDTMTKILKENPGMNAEWDMFVSVPGGRTDPNNWIIQSAIRAAQAVEGTDEDIYEGRGAGQTEAGIIRTWGIPTARVSGAPPNPELPADLRRGFTMSGAYGPNIVKAAQAISYSIIDTLTRSREEVGLEY
jgi:acetylornithine deacetylase/succinyl-diaminopimelate desuccinylase-like protein